MQAARREERAIDVGQPASPPLNDRAYDQAQRRLRHQLDLAERGDINARLAIIEAAAADTLRVNLARVATAAHKVAPSVDEIKILRGQFTADQTELRFAVDASHDALSQAAGRVVEPVAIAPAAQTEKPEPDPRADSGEFPHPAPIDG